MKREHQLAPEQQAQQESQQVAAPGQQPEGATEVYSTEGAMPPVAAAPEAEAEVAAAPTASEQAFVDPLAEQVKPDPLADEKKSEQELIEHAEDYNEIHHSWAQEFNQLTDGACLTHGKLDAIKIRDFQKAHIHITLVADGRISPWTLAAAKQVAEIREKEKADAEAATAPKKENKVAPLGGEVVEEKPATEVVAKAEVAPEVVGAEKAVGEEKQAEPEVAQAGAETEVKTDEIDSEAATRYNLNHSSNVAEFNELTNFANTSGGELDIEKVVAFQKAHGVVADGCIGFQTLRAAKEAAEPVAAVQVPEVSEEQAPAMA
jgi:lysozyme family protein